MNWLSIIRNKIDKKDLLTDPTRTPFGSEDMTSSSDPSQENMPAKDVRDIFQEEPGSAPGVGTVTSPDKKTNDSGKSRKDVFPRIDPNSSVWGEGRTNESNLKIHWLKK